MQGTKGKLKVVIIFQTETAKWPYMTHFLLQRGRAKRRGAKRRGRWRRKKGVQEVVEH